MKRNTGFIVALFVLLTVQSFYGAEKARITGTSSDIVKQIRSLANVDVKQIEFEIVFTQPVDHQNPEAGTFEQRVWVTHKDFSKPVVLWLEGYASRNRQMQEPTRLLDANQIVGRAPLFRGIAARSPGLEVFEYQTGSRRSSPDRRGVQADSIPGNG